jgi:hypothetical protein
VEERGVGEGARAREEPGWRRTGPEMPGQRRKGQVGEEARAEEVRSATPASHGREAVAGWPGGALARFGGGRRDLVRVCFFRDPTRGCVWPGLSPGKPYPPRPVNG